MQEERNKSGSGLPMEIYLESVLFILPRGFQGVIEKRAPVIHAVHHVLNPGLNLLPLGISQAPARAGTRTGGKLLLQGLPYRRPLPEGSDDVTMWTTLLPFKLTGLISRGSSRLFTREKP